MKSSALFISAALALGAGSAAFAQQPAPNVTVNGQTVTLVPAPVVQAGRLFVPLRGVFERLGATVVYQNGQINATAGSRTVSLTIGSTQASVNGNPEQLDVAPFVVGASTYVPLRFVSQALGATVNYDAPNDLVAIVTSQGGPREVVTPIPRVAPPAGVFQGRVLRDEQPAADASVQATRPTISGDFVRPVDPNTLRVRLDGLDVTGDATRSPSGFIFAPLSPLQNVPHTVSLEGRFIDGQPFRTQWQFASGTVAPRNFVHLEDVQNGDRVGGTFTIRGRTLPGARVRIIAGSHPDFHQDPDGDRPDFRRYAYGDGTYVGDTVADGDGRFGLDVTLQSPPDGFIGVTVHTTDPETRESAEARVELRAR